MTLPLRIKFEALCEIFIQSEIGKVKMTILRQNQRIIIDIETCVKVTKVYVK